MALQWFVEWDNIEVVMKLVGDLTILTKQSMICQASVIKLKWTWCWLNLNLFNAKNPMFTHSGDYGYWTGNDKN